jgi:parvulin-like peptidyl-prolyl isomerase
LALLLSLAAASCSGGDGPKSVPLGAVAIVGDVPIQQAQLESILAARVRGAQVSGQQFPTPGTPEFTIARNKIVRNLVEDAEFEQGAKSDFGIEISDQDVEQQVARMASKSYDGSKARLEAAFEQQGIAKTEIRLRVRQELLAAAVFAHLGSKASVSDDEIERYYQGHLEGYRQPASRPLSVILVGTRAEADRLERRLKAGADFAALARRYSTDPSTALAGGRIEGGLARGLAAPAIDKAAFSLETNAVSPAIRTKHGWEILRATGAIRPATTTPLSAVRETIESQLLVEKRKGELKQWVADTKAAYAKKIAYARGYRPAAT